MRKRGCIDNLENLIRKTESKTSSYDDDDHDHPNKNSNDLFFKLTLTLIERFQNYTTCAFINKGIWFLE